jgi:hypothetical protein
MHNFFTIEVEAEMRLQEHQRAAAADARAAQARSFKRSWNWLPRASRSQAILQAAAMSSAPVSESLELTRVPRPVAC